MNKNKTPSKSHGPYDEQYYQDNQQSGDRPALRFFAKVLKKYAPKGMILEYGCGSGFFIKKFDEKKYTKIAYDISDYAMEQTRINNPGIKTVGDPWKDIKKGSLDAIAGLHVLEHIEEPEKTIKDFHTLLKKEGVLFFTVPNMKSVGRKMKGEAWFGYRDDTHISMLMPDEWQKLLNKNGFTIEKVGSDGLWDVPYTKRLPVILEKIIFYPTAAIHMLFNTLFLPLPLGENLVVIARKK